jgi:ATP-dependent exoDNAse (exonuclease V) beta subunit
VTPLVDQEARDRIRGSLDESMVVEAAAGTGKTSELVARLVAVLAGGRGTAQTVVAVTFTEKAAGELKLRLRAELEKARQGAGEGSPRRARLDDAVARLEEARVSTIHGFCNDLLHERPVEARVDPRFRVLAEPEAEALYRRAFDRWVEDQLEQPPEGLRRALRRRATLDDGDPVERIRRAGWTLGDWRDFRAPWRREAWARDAAIDQLVERVHAFAGLTRACTNPADGLYADTWLARRISDDVGVSEPLAPRDHDALEAALVDLVRNRQFRRPRKGYERSYRGVTRDEVLTSHADLCEALDDFARRADADLAALLQQELVATVDAYEALKARAGCLDFLDLLVRTRDLVRDRADVREDLQRRFSHIFVDEFQDTDPLQAEILLLLASADPAVARWRDVTPAPGKLFVVGDPKQSIYRFRRADVGIYQEVKRLLHERGAAVLDLTSSFRAVPSVQRLLNAAFASRMVEDHATLQAGYVPLAPYRAEREGQPSIVALPVPKPYGRWGFTKTAIDASLPDAVAGFVHWLVEKSGWCVTERDRPGEELPVAPRHVCLLFRRFTQWGADVTQPYVEALEARGIAHMLVGGKSFHQREEVETLRTALTAIEWPDDELAVYGTLRGPLFAVGDEALLEYRERIGRLHPFRVRETEAGEGLAPHLAPVAEGLRLLGELHRRRNHRPVEETVAALLTATRAHAAFILRPSGERALANVLRIADLARSFEASGGISFRGFIEQLAEDGAGETSEAPIVEEGSEGVRIMTVHRAKGLEFPVVILADITANAAAQNPGRYIDSERGLCAVRLAGWSPWDLLDHEAEEMARDRAEGARIAYVAATRARDLLVVPAVGDDPFANGWAAAGDGWIEPVQRAIYPAAEARRTPRPAPECPPLGEDSVLERPDSDTPGRDNVQPGLHVLATARDRESPPAEYPVVWWDPRALTLGARPPVGIPNQGLIEDPGADVLEGDRRRYAEWLRARQIALEQGGRASVVVKTVTEWAQRAGDDDQVPEPEVTVIDAASGVARPSGPRFGTLVHAILATVALDAERGAIAEIATMQARILGATSEETAAATALADAALSHPLLLRAREAWRTDRCRRETPITAVEPDGSILEGVLDLAFEDDDGWTVVDFKTQAELAGPLARHRRQVSAYASVVARVTGRPATAVLMRL